MTDATVTATNTTTEMPPIFTCNTCGLSFESRDEQVKHMREDWHVTNVRRRMASLPALLSTPKSDILTIPHAATLQTVDEAQDVHAAAASDFPVDIEENDDDDAVDFIALADVPEVDPTTLLETPPSTQTVTTCLFCPLISSSLTTNYSHMHSAHGLTIPYIDSLHDLSSLVHYLSQIIDTFHSCIYCGTIRNTAEGVRQHMRAKGHCTIEYNEEFEPFYDLERKSEDDFEEEGDEDGEQQEGQEKTEDEAERRRRAAPNDIIRPADLLAHSASDLHLASGRVLSKDTPPRTTRSNRRPINTLDITNGELPRQPTPSTTNNDTSGTSPPTSTSQTPSTSLQTAQNRPKPGSLIRASDRTSLAGLSTQSMRALAAVEKRMKKMTTRAQNERDWAVQKVANQQKHFKVKTRAIGLYLRPDDL